MVLMIECVSDGIYIPHNDYSLEASNRTPPPHYTVLYIKQEDGNCLARCTSMRVRALSPSLPSSRTVLVEAVKTMASPMEGGSRRKEERKKCCSKHRGMVAIRGRPGLRGGARHCFFFYDLCYVLYYERCPLKRATAHGSMLDRCLGYFQHAHFISKVGVEKRGAQ